MIHYCRYLFVKMKVFNYSELHFAEVTFYRIHTLGGTANKDMDVTGIFLKSCLVKVAKKSGIEPNKRVSSDFLPRAITSSHT